MRVALIMCPHRYRDRTTWFETLHNLSKGEPHFIRFFNPLRRRGVMDFRSYPLGLLYLATVIKGQHDARIFNFLEGTTSVEEVVAFAPHVVGFSCSTGSCLIWIDEVARQLKGRCGSAVVMGGPHVTLDPETTLRTTAADFVVSGEGEEVILPLLDHIAGRSSRLPPRGVWRREGGEVRGGPPAVVEDLSLLPEPDHSLLDQSHYAGVHIETSRGCPFRCEFCFLSGMGGCGKHRLRPVESVVRELRTIARLRDLPSSKVYIVDNNFRDNGRVTLLMEALAAAGLRAQFWTATDTHLDRQVMRKMRERGFTFLHSGVESGSPEAFDKVPDREHVLDFFAGGQQLGLMMGADFILGYPEQTPEELRGLVGMARELARRVATGRGPRITFQPHLYRPFPGTALGKRLAARGWRGPSTFRGWGELHDQISRGEVSTDVLPRGVSDGQLRRAMLDFAALNLRHHLLPLAWRRLGF
jgi:radical SAM superfamily enzyme YgiQ (UPF0313 family)